MASNTLTPKTLIDKVALVTGAGRGIGYGIALELGQRGAKVAVNYSSSRKGADRLVKEIEAAENQAIAIQTDISKTPEVKRLFKVATDHFGRLNIGGRIIFMSLVAATMSGIPNYALYVDGKVAMEGFICSFAKNCGHKSITVNAIALGGVKSDMFQQNAWHYSPGGTPGMDLQEIEDGLASLCPLGRVAIPQDIARVVAFLAYSDIE